MEGVKKDFISVKRIVFAGMFTALIAVGAFIKIMIPIGPFSVTFSLQFLFSLLAGILLGEKYGGLSVLSYIILGLLGVPIFAHGGGIFYILKPTFGFIIGFLSAAYITGLFSSRLKKITFLNLFLSCFLGEMSYYFFGLLYYYIMVNFILSETEGIDIKGLILTWFLSTVFLDLILCAVAAILSLRLLPFFKGLYGEGDR